MKPSEHVAAAVRKQLELLLLEPRVRQAIALHDWLEGRGGDVPALAAPEPAPVHLLERARRKPSARRGPIALVPGSATSRIMDVFAANPTQVFGYMEIAKRFPEMPERSASSHLSRLVKSGRLIKPRYGHFQLAPPDDSP